MIEQTDRTDNSHCNIGQRAVDILGRQRWLDRPSYRLERALTIVFAACGRHRDRLTNALHGTWLGHPLHPALTALDATTLMPGHRRGLREASRLTLEIGIVGSVAAEAAGGTDWQHTHEQSRRIGLIRGLLNTVATGPYVMSWLDRRRGRQFRGMAANAVGYGITLASGYLARRWSTGSTPVLTAPVRG